MSELYSQEDDCNPYLFKLAITAIPKVMSILKMGLIPGIDTTHTSRDINDSEWAINNSGIFGTIYLNPSSSLISITPEEDSGRVLDIIANYNGKRLGSVIDTPYSEIITSTPDLIVFNYLNEFLYRNIPYGIFPVLTELKGESDVGRAYLKESELSRRCCSSILIISEINSLDGFDVESIFIAKTRTGITTNNFIKVVIPKAIYEANLEILKDVPGLEIVEYISKMISFEDPNDEYVTIERELIVPNYEKVIKDAVKSTDKPLFIHGVRLS